MKLTQKTTVLGIFAILSSLAQAYTTKDFNQAAAGVSAGFGLIFAAE
jgi:hypothetical protein